MWLPRTSQIWAVTSGSGRHYQPSKLTIAMCAFRQRIFLYLEFYKLFLIVSYLENLRFYRVSDRYEFNLDCSTRAPYCVSYGSYARRSVVHVSDRWQQVLAKRPRREPPTCIPTRQDITSLVLVVVLWLTLVWFHILISYPLPIHHGIF